jgi:hypothetical protein
MPAYCSTSNNHNEELTMAKVKNTGGQARGFITEDGSHVTVAPGEEKEFNMTEADFDHLKKLIDDHDDPKPFEISGSHGGVKSKKDKKSDDDVEMPAQSTEPPAAPQAVPLAAAPPTDKKPAPAQAASPKAPEKK